MTNIHNFYEMIGPQYLSSATTYANYDKLQIDLPCRVLFVGPSGSMKTNSALNWITSINHFNRIWLCTSNYDQPLYRWLLEYYRNIEKQLKKPEGSIFTICTSIDDLPSLTDETAVDKTNVNLFIFDDLVTESTQKMKKVNEIYIKGRHYNCSSFFLTQSYYATNIMIRKNCDYIVMKKLNTSGDITRIVKEYQMSESPKTIMNLYNYAMSGPATNFFLIDLKTTKPDYKFRKNFSKIPTK